MFAKLQLDSNCFPVVSTFAKTSSPNVGVSVPTKTGVSIPSFEKVEPTVKLGEQRTGGTSEAEKVSGFRRSTENQKPGTVFGPELENPDGRQRRTSPNASTSGKRKNLGAKLNWVKSNAPVRKAHTKCSTKWATYGGCIPSILQALDTVKDLDEALRPWEDTLSNKERSIILKEQSSWERAFEIFEWFKSKRCYELNVIHYNIMLRSLGRAKKWSLVESLCREMAVKGIAPINSTYGTLIDVYSKGGLKEKALAWLEKMNQQGMLPDEVTMGIVLQMYKKSGEFQKVEDFFKQWKMDERGDGDSSHDDHSLSLYTYNTLIDTYGKSGQLKEASNIFSEMLTKGIMPTTVTFNTMIHICGNNGHLDEVKSLIQKMQELRCPADTRTYNILISLHTKHDDIDMAAQCLRKMKEEQLEPDLVSYRTLLYAFSIRHMVTEAEDLLSEMDEKGLEIDEYTQSALTRMYIDVGLLEKSWLWFMRFHGTGNMTSECYSATIDAYGERGYISEAEEVFLCSQKNKKLSVLEFNVMIKAYGYVKNFVKACELFDSIESHGVIPDRCSYGSLIQILAGADLAAKAQHYLNKMQEAGLISDCITYCAVISSYAKSGRLDMAKKLYNEMIEFEVKPDVIVYGILINASAEAGNTEEAIGYIDAMRKSGLPGNAVIYNSLIKLYTRVGYLKEAEETYKLLLSSDTGPDVYCSNCMIDLYCEHSMAKQAEEIFRRMKRNGEANEFAYAMMLCMYKRLGRFQEASRVAREMRTLGLLSNLLSYNSVIGLYSLDGRFNDAVATFKEMLDDGGVLPDDFTFKSLGLVLVKCGISKRAVARLEAGLKKDYQSGLQAWLIALCTIVDVEVDCEEDGSH
ncbi:unnamed protein product [Linum tenue]|uniref:PROP1-like PPR domain-containing protein n=2 Tax=Linum tenue TaxID=586396 RepID=A0AAV0P4U9_9ROSI|nr:unnamed protein product [Linum tenue]